jgi:hypothetical protein
MLAMARLIALVTSGRREGRAALASAVALGPLPSLLLPLETAQALGLLPLCLPLGLSLLKTD